MKTGQVVENAIWVTGDEPEGMREKYERDVTESIDELCNDMGFYHSEVTFVEKKPGNIEVPPVPDHIQGQNVRLLIGSADVHGKIPMTNAGSFVNNLDRKDLKKLRMITRKTYAKLYHTIIGNNKCDELIEALGAECAVETLQSN